MKTTCCLSLITTSIALTGCLLGEPTDEMIDLDDEQGLSSSIPEPICPETYDNQEPVDPGIESDSECRGACGPDCPDDPNPDDGVAEGCSETERESCVEFERYEQTMHKICVYRELSCGTHAGCRTHDACFDTCADAHPPGKARNRCMGVCNSDCVAQYGFSQCLGWAQGHGPYDGTIEFSELTSCSEFEGPCDEELADNG